MPGSPAESKSMDACRVSLTVTRRHAFDFPLRQDRLISCRYGWFHLSRNRRCEFLCQVTRSHRNGSKVSKAELAGCVMGSTLPTTSELQLSKENCINFSHLPRVSLSASKPVLSTSPQLACQRPSCSPSYTDQHRPNSRCLLPCAQ